ncbi:glycine oxidase ThiO [methanotrophic endosymbiont of Bathymodiolus puteoserpentis (Logatchev)]|jgi:glycine oxidase|uniref:glycine oxidase ThiO n=1 Tax=methanotrophic endosymbiont of Bathymodiolus puteoserpentis (Logatchev) TaxID=343235 RepID=UPI0013CD16BB|nr:glycine oxidase ThiO [methanotrophic endosymbiont of Bathymodiolus puteoserpentis (Logatchev)]SHE20841.1 Glycine oxidase ThiO [methanotrophic endosymbiont of Bathymodiolus puteoserpentis (Logatchev)]
MSDITLVGGGITGLLCARLFALAGASVTLIEKNQIGQESSWAGGGILLPLYPWRQADAISQLVIPSIEAYPKLSQALIDTTGIDPEYIVSGLLMNALPDLDKAHAWSNKHAIKTSLTSSEQRQQFPHINNASLYLPNIAQVRNPRLLKSLKQDLLQRGVKIIENCAIEKMTIKDNRIIKIASQTKILAVKQLVISAGAWTGKLWTQLLGKAEETPAKIFPVKGQMLIFDAPIGTLDTMVLENNRYLIPRRDGKILCGSTVEYADFDKTTSVQAKQSLVNFAHNLFPVLQSAPVIHHWSGLRPGTEQGIPYIDLHPEIQNLAINAGHFRNGFAMGPASAQLLYDLVTKQAPQINPTPYQLSAQH